MIKTMDGTQDFLWLFYWGLTLTVNNLWINLGMPANSGEPNAMINLATSFVYILLMGGRRGMKSILAAVQAALSLHGSLCLCRYTDFLMKHHTLTVQQKPQTGVMVGHSSFSWTALHATPPVCCDHWRHWKAWIHVACSHSPSIWHSPYIYEDSTVRVARQARLNYALRSVCWLLYTVHPVWVGHKWTLNLGMTQCDIFPPPSGNPIAGNFLFDEVQH